MIKTRWASALRKDRANALMCVRFHITRQEARQRVQTFSPALLTLALRPAIVKV